MCANCSAFIMALLCNVGKSQKDRPNCPKYSPQKTENASGSRTATASLVGRPPFRIVQGEPASGRRRAVPKVPAEKRSIGHCKKTATLFCSAIPEFTVSHKVICAIFCNGLYTLCSINSIIHYLISFGTGEAMLRSVVGMDDWLRLAHTLLCQRTCQVQYLRFQNGFSIANQSLRSFTRLYIILQKRCIIPLWNRLQTKSC
jgi:hypothetical protein